MFYIYVLVTGWGGITLTIPRPSQQWSHNVYQNLEKAWERGYYVQHWPPDEAVSLSPCVESSQRVVACVQRTSPGGSPLEPEAKDEDRNRIKR